MVFLAGAPYYELVKEREGAPSFLPRCSRLFFSIFPSFSLAVLSHDDHFMNIKSRHSFYNRFEHNLILHSQIFLKNEGEGLSGNP